MRSGAYCSAVTLQVSDSGALLVGGCHMATGTAAAASCLALQAAGCLTRVWWQAVQHRFRDRCNGDRHEWIGMPVWLRVHQH
jgi:hypothetical protein